MNIGDYKINDGFAHEITLSNGKKHYTGLNSIRAINAKKQGLKVAVVRYKGCCICSNINSRAKDKHHFPIEINGVDIYTFIDKVADYNEPIE